MVVLSCLQSLISLEAFVREYLFSFVLINVHFALVLVLAWSSLKSKTHIYIYIYIFSKDFWSGHWLAVYILYCLDKRR